ncbi:MAG: tripartite tricarboxylate transporter substrate binding protein [Burkholderiales bacterium]|jgi:tripartite-type tricarboxylate transporter receptor subunit TctC
MKTLLAAIAISLAASTGVQAQGWPDKAVTMVVPFPPGGSTDVVGRAVAAKLADKFGKPFVVENKSGATGTIGATAVKRSAPDGYTFFVTSLGPLVIVPHLLKHLQYDALKDFDPITVAVQAPNVLVVPVASPHKTLADVIAYEKANPGKMTFASSGTGSSDHLTAALFWQQTGTTGLHIPYKGGAPALSDLLGGQVDATFANINTVIQQIRAGKLRPLVITSRTRSPLLPNVPTAAEAGVKGLEVYSWQAIVAPKGVPADVISKMHDAIVAALNDPQVKDRFVTLGFEIVGNTPAQFADFEQQEFARWKKVIEVGHITAD